MDYPKVVYAIQHRVTKKIYIGVTNSLEKRYQAHLSLLRNNKHNSQLMQEEYNQFGGLYDVFVLDEIQHAWERFKEFEWMMFYDTKNPKHGYNANDKANGAYSPKVPFKSGRPERII